MPDFGPRWQNPEKLSKGGQALTYTVEDANAEGTKQTVCVAKIVNQPAAQRQERFKREVEICKKLDHPNVVRVIDFGTTVGHAFPFFVMPFYVEGTLEENFEILGSPLKRLHIFLQICKGAAYAHSQGLVHRDLKPSNIFLQEDGLAVVGDFGLAYRHEQGLNQRLTATEEAVGSRKYIPPEWREGRVDVPQVTGDLYSLGKILYWLFVGKVYDGHEDDHESSPGRKVIENFHQTPELPGSYQEGLLYRDRWLSTFSFVDDIVRETLRKDPLERLNAASKLIDKVETTIDRVESNGRALNLELPMRCIFCAAGNYRPSHHLGLRNRPGGPGAWPNLSRRQADQPGLSIAPSIYAGLGDVASDHFGNPPGKGAPLVLICDFCGNVQQFRLDLTNDQHGGNWRP